MFQQIFALIIIFLFLSRLIWQKKKEQIQATEFIFWLVFWLLTAAAVIFLKQIDKFVSFLGFSGSGIEVLFYVAVAAIFYLIFRVRLKMEKMERDITKIVSCLSLKNNSNKK
jgi:hypothetical protein